MEAYWQGLTGKAAKWVVRQQKSHQRVGEQAMTAIEAVVDKN